MACTASQWHYRLFAVVQLLYTIIYIISVSSICIKSAAFICAIFLY
nr:MAG TPA: hypothetical protein [Caudoviricetes sp.]